MKIRQFVYAFFTVVLFFRIPLAGQALDTAELGYEDGLAPNVQLTFLLNGGYRFVVRFTPPATPSQLVRIRYYLADTTKGTGFYLHILDDNYNAPKHEPAADLIDSIRVSGGRLGWNDYDLADRRIFVERDFYVGFYYDLKSKLTLGAENREPVSKRAYDSDCCSWWVLENVDLYIRAALKPPASAVGKNDGHPETAVLIGNYPNPFNSSAVIRYRIQQPGQIDLTVFDSFGRPVRKLNAGWTPPGNFQAEWNGTDDRGNSAASGVYVVRLSTQTETFQRKLLLIR